MPSANPVMRPKSPDRTVARPTRFVQPEHAIGIGELHVLVGSGTLITFALGSCVGICLFDASAQVAGMIHIMLPSASVGGASSSHRPHVFADTGIAALRTKMLAQGASPTAIRAKVFGGAQMFQAGGDLLAVGKRNVLATRKAVWKLKLAVDVQDVGGREARTLHMDVSSGRVLVSKPGNRREWV